MSPKQPLLTEELGQGDKKSRKRRRSERDESYRPQKRHKKLDSQSILRMRTENRAVKTTILVDESLLFRSPLSRNKYEFMKENFPLNLQTIATHRPVGKILQRTAFGSPIIVDTPEKQTKLFRRGKLGGISLFSDNQVTASSPNIQPVGPDFSTSEQYQMLKKINEKYKLQVLTITPQVLEQTKQEYAENNNKRASSQNQQMVEKGFNSKKAGATPYVMATKIFSDNIESMRWEWLHLVAYSILGKKGHNDASIVGGSQHANTEMMFIESQIPYLTEKYPEGFSLEVKANLIENTHIATTIEYTIRTKDFTLPLVFNAQNTIQPDIAFQNYVRVWVETLVEASQPNNLLEANEKKSTSTFGSPFFTKEPDEKTKEEPKNIRKPK